MILAKGTLLPDEQLPQVLRTLEEEIDQTRAARRLEPEILIQAVEELGRMLDSGALDRLIAQFVTPEMLGKLGRVRHLLSRRALEEKLATELGCTLWEDQPRAFGAARAVPLGTLLHVTAGNVDGLSVFSAAEGLLTGNVNLIKLPREDKGLSLAILTLLVQQEPRLADFIYAFDVPSSDTRTMKKLASLADGIALWGGDEAVRAWRGLAGPGCKLMEWGHRLSFAYLSGWEDKAAELTALADHIIETGGLLCSSCQVVYVDTEDPAQAQQLCRELLAHLEQAARRKNTSPGQRAQATLYAYQTVLEQAADGRTDRTVFRGTGCSVTLCRDRELELSFLNGNVLVKCLPRQELLPVLRARKGQLQTAGLICAPERRGELTDLLTRAGLTRITRAGTMSDAFVGEGHDGEYPLRRYIRMVDIED